MPPPTTARGGSWGHAAGVHTGALTPNAAHVEAHVGVGRPLRLAVPDARHEVAPAAKAEVRDGPVTEQRHARVPVLMAVAAHAEVARDHRLPQRLRVRVGLRHRVVQVVGPDVAGPDPAAHAAVRGLGRRGSSSPGRRFRRLVGVTSGAVTWWWLMSQPVDGHLTDMGETPEVVKGYRQTSGGFGSGAPTLSRAVAGSLASCWRRRVSKAMRLRTRWRRRIRASISAVSISSMAMSAARSSVRRGGGGGGRGAPPPRRQLGEGAVGAPATRAAEGRRGRNPPGKEAVATDP